MAQRLIDTVVLSFFSICFGCAVFALRQLRG